LDSIDNPRPDVCAGPERPARQISEKRSRCDASPDSFVQLSASVWVGVDGSSESGFVSDAHMMVELVHSEFSASAFGDDTSTWRRKNKKTSLAL
jgi:hypothetical protein